MSDSAPKQRNLLPTDVRPTHYAVTLTPDFDNFSFSGTVVIDLDVQAPTTSIHMHALDLTFGDIAVVQNTAVATKAPIFTAAEERVEIPLDATLAVGPATLTIAFVGVLNDKMAGFYRSTYTGADGSKRIMGTTQFEATDARRAFPCWDEPAIKATFSVTLTVPKHMEALSNMPTTSVSEQGEKKVFVFDKTPIMSTYLVAFVVGEFEFLEQKTKNNVVMRVYTPLGKKEQGRFALECGCKVLDYYTEYFGVPYPLPKSDMIAIADFSAGAMENWGLITYRETALLIDAVQSGLASKQRVAYVVAHELAHQWFGNLVTMEWWKELWLNEGFATFVGVQATDFLFPEWDQWTNFVSDYSNRGLLLDALESSHPVEQEVWSSADVSSLFDHISYLKGAAINRMTSDYIGEAAMRKGLNIYLNRHQYGNAVTTDLWKALGEASGKDVEAFMSRWTKVMGFPVVSVARDGNGFKISQKRFLASGKTPEEGHWWLSMAVAGPDGTTVKMDIKDKEQTITLPKELSGASWLKFNAGQAGFYRVAYGDDLAAALAKAIASLELPAVDRLSVQSDAFALAKAGQLSTVSALRLARAYSAETELAVWSDLAGSLLDLAAVYRDDVAAPGICALIAQIFEAAGARLGWTARAEDSPLDPLIRAVVLRVLVGVNHTDTVAQAKVWFDTYAAAVVDKDAVAQEKVKTLPVDLRSTVFYAGVKYGDEASYERALALYHASTMQEESVRLMSALGSAKPTALATRTLDWALAGKDVRSQDVCHVVAACAGGNPAATWAHVKNKWAKYNDMFGDGAFLIARIVGSAASAIPSDQHADEVEAFFKVNPCPHADRTISQSLEKVRANAAWLKRDKADVFKYLADEKLIKGAVSGVH